MIRQVVPVFFDIEKARGAAGAIHQIGLLSGINGNTFTARIRTSNEETQFDTFSNVMKSVSAWIQREEADGQVVLVGHNAKRYDDIEIRKRLSLTGEGELWPQRTVFDTLDLSKKVDPAKQNHKLARLKRKYKVEGEQHDALSDCRITAEILRKMLYPLPLSEVYPLIGRSDAVSAVCQRFRRVQIIKPVLLDLTLTGRVKQTKFTPGVEPEIIRIQAHVDGRVFDTLVKPRSKIDTTEGIQNRNVQAKNVAALPDAFKALKRFLRDGTNSQFVFLAWDAWNRESIAFTKCLEPYGKNFKSRFHYFDIAYLPRLPKSLWDSVYHGPRDIRFDRVLKSLGIKKTGSRIQDLGLLTDRLLGRNPNQEILRKMTEFPSVQPVQKALREEQKPVVFWIDLETTGLIGKDADGNQDFPAVTQIHVESQTGKIFSHFVRPWREIEEKAAEVTRLTMDPKNHEYTYIGDMPGMERISQLFIQFVNAQLQPGDVPVFVAHNGDRFDRPVLENELQRVGIDLVNCTWFDTMWLAAKVLGGGVKGKSIKALTEVFNIKQVDAHRADSDVSDMRAIAEKLFGVADRSKIFKAMLEPKATDAVYDVIVSAVEPEVEELITFSSDDEEGAAPLAAKRVRLHRRKPVEK